MKKLFLLFLFFMQAKGMYAQTQVDTIGLLKQTILNNKTNFIGKPFSALVNSLSPSLPIKHYSPEWFGGLKNRQTSFGFIDVENVRRSPKNIIYIYIYWQNPESRDNEATQWRKLPAGQWSQDDFNYYKDWIVKDIKVWVIGQGGYEVK